MQTIQLPPALACAANGRDHITTSRVCPRWRISRAADRAEESLPERVLRVRPIKRGKLLLWPVADVAQALSGAA
jgi:hypothetical protein